MNTSSFKSIGASTQSKIVRDYSDNGLTINQLMLKYKSAPATLKAVLRSHKVPKQIVIGVGRKKALAIVRDYTPEETDKFSAKFGMTLLEVAHKHSSTAASVRKILAFYNVPIRERNNLRRERPYELAIVRMWSDERLSSKSISRLLDLPRHQVALYVTRYCPIDDRVFSMVRSVIRSDRKIKYADIKELPRSIGLTGRCDICQEFARLQLDHCHSSGYVRGLLCLHCNSALGHFRDDPKRMKRAISYVS